MQKIDQAFKKLVDIGLSLAWFALALAAVFMPLKLIKWHMVRVPEVPIPVAVPIPIGISLEPMPIIALAIIYYTVKR